MKTCRRFAVYALSLLALLVLITVVRMIITPMRRPGRILESQILRITPLGTCIDDVIEIINERDDWANPNVNREFGFNPSSPWSNIDLPHSPQRGAQFVSIPFGVYRTWLFWPPFAEVSVSITWIFDSAGELIEVFVQKIGMF